MACPACLLTIWVHSATMVTRITLERRSRNPPMMARAAQGGPTQHRRTRGAPGARGRTRRKKGTAIIQNVRFARPRGGGPPFGPRLRDCAKRSFCTPGGGPWAGPMSFLAPPLAAPGPCNCRPFSFAGRGGPSLLGAPLPSPEARNGQRAGGGPARSYAAAEGHEPLLDYGNSIPSLVWTSQRSCL